jgi:Gas vesicle protein K
VTDKVVTAQGDVARVARRLEELGDVFPRRIDSDPETVERGLAQLVLTLIELLRQLMERQALRRVDDWSLTEDQIERIGLTLMALEDRMAELREHFGLKPEDLNLDLGPLGQLLSYE